MKLVFKKGFNKRHSPYELGFQTKIMEMRLYNIHYTLISSSNLDNSDLMRTLIVIVQQVALFDAAFVIIY